MLVVDRCCLALKSSVDLASDVAFEAADDFDLAHAFPDSAAHIGFGSVVVVKSDHNDAMESGIGLTVAAALPARSVVEHHGQAERELLRFALPVADHRGGANQQVRSLVALLVIPQDGGQCLDRFPESHIVGQVGAKSPPAEEIEPRVAQLLIGAEFAAEFGVRVQQPYGFPK